MPASIVVFEQSLRECLLAKYPSLFFSDMAANGFAKEEKRVLVSSTLEHAHSYSQGRFPVACFSTFDYFNLQGDDKRNNDFHDIAVSCVWRISQNVTELILFAKNYAEQMIENIERSNHSEQDEEILIGKIMSAAKKSKLPGNNNNRMNKIDEKFQVTIGFPFANEETCSPSCSPELLRRFLFPSANRSHDSEKMLMMIDFTFGCDQRVRKICHPANAKQYIICKIPHREPIKIQQEIISCNLTHSVIPTPAPPLETAPNEEAANEVLVQECLDGIPLIILSQMMKPHIPDSLEKYFPSSDKKSTSSAISSTTTSSNSLPLIMPAKSYLEIFRQLGRMMATYHHHSITNDDALAIRRTISSAPASKEYFSANCDRFTVTVAPPQPGTEWVEKFSQHLSLSSPSEYECNNVWVADTLLSPSGGNENRKVLVIEQEEEEGEQRTLRPEYFSKLVELDSTSLFERVPELFSNDKELCRKKVEEFHRELFQRIQQKGNSYASVLVHQDVTASNVILKAYFKNEDDGESILHLVPQLIDWGDANFGIRENDFAPISQELYGTPMWDKLIEGYEMELRQQQRKSQHDTNLATVEANIALDHKLIFMLGVKRCLWTFDRGDDSENEICVNSRKCREFAMLKKQFCL